MRELKKTIKKNGYLYEQVARSNSGYIYAQKSADSAITYAYEVFRRKINKRWDCISFPSNEEFGRTAWVYHSLEAAVEKLKTFDLKK